jgi:hypothetical protein
MRDLSWREDWPKSHPDCWENEPDTCVLKPCVAGGRTYEVRTCVGMACCTKGSRSDFRVASNGTFSF